jgi:hypothetical protein
MTTFILTRSDQGDGGWSLHAPGSTDEDIATGEASALVTGVSRKRAGKWLRPNARDYADAAMVFARDAS